MDQSSEDIFHNLPLPEVLQKSLKAFQWPQRTMLRGSKLLNNALHTEFIFHLWRLCSS